MNNKFINNNGVNLLNISKNKKTLVESRIEALKQQEQAIITELERWEIKSKKADKLLVYLAEVNKFSTTFLAEVVKAEKENPNDYHLEHLIKNKVEFVLKFEPSSEAFYQLVWQKIEFEISQLKAERNAIQDQLLHQERIFVRIEIRRQGRELLTCEYKNRLGCLGVYRCDNCQINYSATDSQATEISK